MNNKFKFGFTLIEILVVVAIIASLSVIIYASFGGAKAGSRDQKRISDISSIQLALEQHFNKNSFYPLTLSNLVPTYMPEIPKDPSTEQIYEYLPLVRTQGTNLCVSYHLWTKFEKNNSHLSSKRGFNSSSIDDNNPEGGFYRCLGSSATGIDASSDVLIYDVLPQ